MTMRTRSMLAGALVVLLGGAGPAADWQQTGRALLKQLVEIDSTHAHGSTIAAEAMAARLRQAGFADADMTVIAPPGKPTKGNLIVRIHGTGQSKPVLFMGHLDVVEADPADWSQNPFRLAEKDGYLYGRGTIDMKGQDAAMLTAMMRLHAEGFRPPRDIVVMLTADEEAGGDDNGPDFLLRTHRALIDAAYAFNPDTAGSAELKDGKPYYISVETSEKQYLTYALSATDKGGHSSEPTPANPIDHVASAVARIDAYRFPTHLTPTVRKFLSERAALEAPDLAADMRSVAQPVSDPQALARLQKNAEIDLHLRTTCVTTQITGGQSESALPEHASAVVQCRVIPGEIQDQITDRLILVIADPKVQLRVTWPAMASPESAPANAVWQAITSTVHSMWPDLAVIPSMTLGASDAAYTRNAGIPTYGIDATFLPLGDDRAHGRDERTSIKGFDDDLTFMYRMMKAASELPGN